MSNIYKYIKEADALFVGGDPLVKRENMILDLAKKNPKDKFAIIGSKNTFTSLNNVKYFERINRSELLNIFKFSKRLIFSGIRESCPYVLLEAMKSGVICIGANKGGIPEIIKNNDNGFMFVGDNVYSLFKVYKKAKKCDEERIKKMAKLTIQENFNINKNIKIYEKILSNEITSVRLIPTFGENNGVATHGYFLSKYGNHNYSFKSGKVVNSHACGVSTSYKGKIDVYTAHSYYGNEKGKFGKIMNNQIIFNAKNAKKVIAVSDYVKDFLLLNNIESSKITLIRNGVEV